MQGFAERLAEFFVDEQSDQIGGRWARFVFHLDGRNRGRMPTTRLVPIRSYEWMKLKEQEGGCRWFDRDHHGGIPHSGGWIGKRPLSLQ